jgi:ribosomal L5P family C-terminus
MGVREQIIFPEIDYDAIDQVRGLDVTITTSAKTDEEAYALLRELGMPFSPAGAPGQEVDAQQQEEEARRLEEAHAKAEAEERAYEELKEENPEAYETPAPAQEDETAESEEAQE